MASVARACSPAGPAMRALAARAAAARSTCQPPAAKKGTTVAARPSASAGMASARGA